MARRLSGFLLAVFSPVALLSSLIAHGQFWDILRIVGVLAGLASIYILRPLLRDWLRFRRPVRFVDGFDKGLGCHFRAQAVLDRLASSAGEVTVVARTGVSWLGGEGMREKVVAAIRAGSTIHLVVPKHLMVPNPPVYFSGADGDAELREHLRKTIQEYEAVRAELEQEHRPRLQLSLTDQPVFFSMVKIIEKNCSWMLVSMRVDLKPSERRRKEKAVSSDLIENRSAWDPHIVVRQNAWQFKDYEDRLNGFLKGHAGAEGTPGTCGAMSYEEYKKNKERLLQAIQTQVEEHKECSPLRRDSGANLAAEAVRHHLARRKGGNIHVPPACVQLLVTSRCPGHCKMCTQSQRKVPEPSLDDLRNMLSHVAAAGTKSVVISGGEPLYRSDILDVLRHAKDLGLNVGLMTRGLKPLQGDQPSRLTEEEVRSITDSCRWIQLSVDSFCIDHYRKENHPWTLELAMDAVKRLWHAVGEDGSRMEVCYTIQRDNVAEVPDMRQHLETFSVPADMRIRLKLAHAASGKDDGFVCTTAELLDLRHRVLPVLKLPNANTKYLQAKLAKDRELSDVARGQPVASQLVRHQQEGDFCAVLDMTCTIDCDGQLYSCCHLFDDNDAESSTRHVGRFETLRGGEFNRIPEKRNGDAYFERLWKKRRSRTPLADAHDLDWAACARCTRHMHQNAFLNSIYRVLEAGDDYHVADDLLQLIDQARDTSAKHDVPVSAHSSWCSTVSKNFWL